LLLSPFTRVGFPNLSFMPARPQGVDYHHASQILPTPIDRKEVDSSEEYFCVHDNPYAVATGARDEEWPDYYSVSARRIRRLRRAPFGGGHRGNLFM